MNGIHKQHKKIFVLLLLLLFHFSKHYNLISNFKFEQIIKHKHAHIYYYIECDRLIDR